MDRKESLYLICAKQHVENDKRTDILNKEIHNKENICIT